MGGVNMNTSSKKRASATVRERHVYQAQVDAADQYRNNYNNERMAALQLEQDNRDATRQDAEAQAAAAVAAAAQQAGIDATALQETMLTKNAIEWWKNKNCKNM